MCSFIAALTSYSKIEWLEPQSFCHSSWFYGSIQAVGAREMAQLLTALAVLTED